MLNRSLPFKPQPTQESSQEHSSVFQTHRSALSSPDTESSPSAAVPKSVTFLEPVTTMEPRQTRTTILRQQMTRQVAAATAATQGRPSGHVAHVAQLQGSGPDLSIGHRNEQTTPRQRYAGFMATPATSRSHTPGKSQGSAGKNTVEVQISSIPRVRRERESSAGTVNHLLDDPVDLISFEEPSDLANTGFSSPAEASSSLEAAKKLGGSLTPSKTALDEAEASQANGNVIPPSGSFVIRRSESYGYEVRQHHEAHIYIYGDVDVAGTLDGSLPENMVKQVRFASSDRSSSASSSRNVSVTSQSLNPTPGHHLEVRDNGIQSARHGGHTGITGEGAQSPTLQTPQRAEGLGSSFVEPPAQIIITPASPSGPIAAISDVAQPSVRRESRLSRPTAGSAVRQSANTFRQSSAPLAPAVRVSTAAANQAPGTRDLIETFVRRSAESLTRALPGRRSGESSTHSRESLPLPASAAAPAPTRSVAVDRRSFFGGTSASGRRATHSPVAPRPSSVPSSIPKAKSSRQSKGAASPSSNLGNNAARGPRAPSALRSSFRGLFSEGRQANRNMPVENLGIGATAVEDDEPIASVAENVQDHIESTNVLLGLSARQMEAMLLMIRGLPQGELRTELLAVGNSMSDIVLDHRTTLLSASQKVTEAAKKAADGTKMVAETYASIKSIVDRFHAGQ